MKNTHYLSSLINTTMLLLVGVMAPTIAQAIDAKTIPGLACQQSNGAQAGDFHRHSPSIRNASTGFRQVVCPIVRDNTVNTNGTAAGSTDVRVYNAGGKLWCYLHSSDAVGNAKNWHYQSSTAVGKFALQNDLNVSQKYGYYNLHCGLPSNSRVYGYRIGEW